MQLTKPAYIPFPLSPTQLDDYRLKALRRARYTASGGHISRRKGQSLEFREFTPYIPGDDVRHIDWRASARYGGENDWLVRRFQAEEKMRFVLSVDCSPSLWLPQRLNKLQIAFWLMHAIAWIANAAEEEVYLHTLFGEEDAIPIKPRRKSERMLLNDTLGQLYADTSFREEANIQPLKRILQPTTVWVIFTDLYFVDNRIAGQLNSEAEKIAHLIAEARSGFRWVVLVDLDSWDYERAQIGEGAYRIDGPGLTTPSPAYEIDQKALDDVKLRIADTKHIFIEKSKLPISGITRWPWSDFDEAPATFFERQFLEDTVLSQLFERTT